MLHVTRNRMEAALKRHELSKGNSMAGAEVAPATLTAGLSGTRLAPRMLALSLVASLVLVGLWSDAQAQSSTQVYLPIVEVPGTGPAPVPAGLVAWWPGDAGADDISCNMHNGSWQGGINIFPGKVGNAFKFDGVSRYVLIPDTTTNLTPDPLDPTAAATLDAWVYFNQTPGDAGHYMTIVAKSYPARDLDLQAENGDNRFHFYVAGGQSVNSSTLIQARQWYFVAATYEAGRQITMYVHGAPERTHSISGITRLANGAPWTIGASFEWAGRFFDGLVDEVELFNRALMPDEIQRIYAAGSLGKDKSGTCD